MIRTPFGNLCLSVKRFERVLLKVGCCCCLACLQVKALSATLSAEDSSIVTSAVADIATSLKSLRSKIASVAAALKQITLKAGDLSQAVGNQASQLKRFVALVRAAELDALAVARNVRDIHGARSRFIPVSRRPAALLS